MHFVLPFPLLLLLSCHENKLWLACFCWIKYILPIPTHHLTVLSCLLFVILRISPLQCDLNTPVCNQSPNHAGHLCCPWDCLQIPPPSQILGVPPWPPSSSTHSLGMTVPRHPHIPPATSSPSQATPLCPRAEKAIKGEKESKRKLKFILKNVFGKTVTQERCLFHFPLRDSRKREEFLKSYNEILLWMSHD